ncbi:Gluconate transport-inducing protein [Tieghemiomyces parasiticus]|uniref:Gluconate transport-inducing protein n=1 Tax=Tieghemiomyces parasiticus TaxID=78921 RepID=A0A9W8A330_9FUNG|nr:Gluconate transport-inducing protein [Tieghemiomyces parasiticus]
MLESYTGYIETGHDALLLFEACRRGILHRVQRRLGEKERNTIRSGSIFVWDEEESGMKRWTDGKSWSASRVLGCFLTYQETEARRRSGAKPSPSVTLPTLGVHSGSTSPCTRTSSSPPVIDLTSPSTSSTTASHLVKESGLIKKALSLTTTDNHKLHLICYYSKADILARRLTTPTYDPRLAGLAIPYGYYPEMAPELGNPTETVFYSPAYAPRESQLPVYLVNRTPSYPPHYGHLPLQHSAHVRFGPPHLPPLISPKRLFDVVLGESSRRPKMEPLPPPSSLFDAAVSFTSPVPVLSVYSEDRRQLDALRSVLTL